MNKIGIDFDNTLISYDKLFKKVALEKELIPNDFPESKNLIRNFLREKDQENIFTIIQGEVYGKRIFEALEAEGMSDALKFIKKRGFEIFIVSHKTKIPYSGPKYDLHKAAISWLEANFFFEVNGINIPRENVYFEVSKEKKIKRLEKLRCNYFIDDLPEILNMINSNIKKILYNPKENNLIKSDYIIMKNWSDLKNLII